MEKKVIVLSLGGSLIVPDEINLKFLENFKRILEKYNDNYKFVVVCGGGSVARKYIKALKESGKSEYLQSMAGIAITRINARFMTYFFGKDASQGIPHDMKDVKSLSARNEVVFCGALRYAEKQTSDSTAAKLAAFLKTDFVNLTVVSGLYNKNPFKHKGAKFIPEISWYDFLKMTNKIKYKPGQHFVLDQEAARIIKENRIRTYILGENLNEFSNFLSGKKFKGTVIEN